MDSVLVLSHSLVSATSFRAGEIPPNSGDHWFAIDGQHPILTGIANSPNRLEEWNPIVVYGPEATGKSSLARVLAEIYGANSGPAEKGGKSIVSVSMGEFDKRMRHAAVVGALEERLAEWRSPRCWILEDYHRFGGSPFTDEMLVRLLDSRTSQRRMTIFCGQFAPWSGPAFSPRLQSRLSAGLWISLQRPTEAVVRAVADGAARALGLVWQPDALTCAVASHVCLRSLIDHLREIAGRPTGSRVIDRDAIKPLTTLRGDWSIRDSQRVLASVARRFRLRMADLTGHSRRQALVKARGIAICLLRDLTRLKWNKIAELTGRQDHSTVLHAYNKTRELFAKDPSLAEAYRELHQELAATRH